MTTSIHTSVQHPNHDQLPDASNDLHDQREDFAPEARLFNELAFSNTSHGYVSSNSLPLQTSVPQQLNALSLLGYSVNNAVIGTNSSNSIQPVVDHIKTGLSMFGDLKSNGAFSQSFTVLMPNQSSLNVGLNVSASGIINLKLSSDETRFDSWLNQNRDILRDELSKELNLEVCILTSNKKPGHVGASAR